MNATSHQNSYYSTKFHLAVEDKNCFENCSLIAFLHPDEIGDFFHCVLILF